MKILAVDDRKDDLYLLNKMLEGKGHQVISARNGKEALKKAEKVNPDMVISDILMPEMDGYQLIKKLKSKENLSNIPFVFYTATYTSKKDEQFAYSLGASSFIIKPQEPEKFLETIDKTINSHGKGILTSAKPKIKEDGDYLKEYNERLVQKLEDMVTELQKAREDLKGSRDFLESILNSINDAVIFIDNRGKVALANRKGGELQKEILKKVGPEIERGEYDCNFDFSHKDRFYDIACFPVSTTRNKNLGTTIVARDITRRRKIKEELDKRVYELEKWQKLTVGREIKMIELKKKIKELQKKLNES